MPRVFSNSTIRFFYNNLFCHFYLNKKYLSVHNNPLNTPFLSHYSQEFLKQYRTVHTICFP